MEQYLFTALKASLEAGKKILKVYNSDFSFENKEDNSPLTLADKNAHDIITEYLSATPFPILSEEGTHAPYSERKTWETLWIVDPLDGTKEFIKRNGEFTVNIALVKNGIPIMGIIYIPVSSTLYFSSKEIGAFKVENICFDSDLNSLEELINKSIKLPLNITDKPYTVAVSRSHLSDETKEYLEELKSKHGEVQTISKGSSLKFCIIAEGLADEYPRNAPTMEWDTAAGHAILNSTGYGIFLKDSEEEISYNKSDLLNPFFIVKKIDN
ncbi:MAG: 3'(2'),5'-bisphosphate nucleotidase CysQ [Flavobacteriales bacterium]|nr:3'(2'),5'-bisphosphate nucleotidase CysQ [Flavobacteriales bacterium]